MDWTAPVDAYCERLGPGFWSEPANALSNAAFLLAAWVAGRAACRAPSDQPVLLLALLVGVVGVGSFLFHTFANAWSGLADVIPIGLFINGYFFLALRRFFLLSMRAALIGTVLFLAAGLALPPYLEDVLPYGSASYAPALLALFGVGGLLMLRGHPAGRPVLGAGALFALSLGLRTADMPLCHTFPLGTHFFWHGLNALVLWCLLETARRQGASGRVPGHASVLERTGTASFQDEQHDRQDARTL